MSDKDPLPKRYMDLISSHLVTVESVISEGGIGKESASIHKKALKSLLAGKPNESIVLLEKSNALYEKIGINETYPELLKCKGDCLLHGIIINNIYEEKYNLETFKPIGESAFLYLWISVEMSHYKLLESLTSISELLFFFVEGSMITIAAGIQTIPPTHFPEYLSIVSEYFLIVYGGIELRSIGNPTEKRHLFVMNPEVVPIDQERKKYLENQINMANNRIDELTEYTKEKYGHNISSGKEMQTSIMNPISTNDNTSYFDFFDIMIRNLKRTRSHSKIFKQIPVSFDEAYANENAHLLYTLTYSDMYGDNKKTYEEVSQELLELAECFNNDRKYGIANTIAREAKFFNQNDARIEAFIEKNGKQFVEYEERFL